MLLRLLPVLYLCLAYDSSVQYSPQGLVLQVEYARQRAHRGGSAIGLRCRDGVLLVTAPNRPKNKLHVRYPQKLHLVDEHVCIAATGLLFDCTILVDRARQLCVQYRNEYQTRIPIEVLVDKLGADIHDLTRRVSSRPLGASLLVGGSDAYLGHQLYAMDPDGSFDAWSCTAVGRDSKSFIEGLRDLDCSSMLVADAWPRLRRALEEQLLKRDRQREADRGDYLWDGVDVLVGREQTTGLSSGFEWASHSVEPSPTRST